MTFSLFLVHSFLAIILFLIINVIGKHSISAGYLQISLFAKVDENPAFNFLYKTMTPIIYITLISALLYSAKYDWVVYQIFWVVPYQMVFRVIFCLATGRGHLLNWMMQVTYLIVSTLIAYWVYYNIIEDKTFFFPEKKDLGNALWLAVIAFIYHTCNSIRTSGVSTKKRKAHYLRISYTKFNSLYEDIIDSIAQNNTQKCLIYAILIYENFNRPKLYRLLENILFYAGYAKTLGVMQVTTKVFINDKESVKLGSHKIVQDYLQIANQMNNHNEYSRYIILKTALHYNPDESYMTEIVELFDFLDEHYFQIKQREHRQAR